MKLTDADIGDFKTIIKEDYGVELLPEEARQEAEQLMQFAFSLFKPPAKPP